MDIITDRVTTSCDRRNNMFAQKFVAVSVGNIMEWYDFAVFGSFADVIALQFFPADTNSNLSLLKSFAVFGAAFYARPIGGLVFGYVGDKFGRKRALELSILLMLISSIVIGCLPTYRHVGIYAVVILIMLRACQGIAAGGELIGMYIFAVESVKGGTDSEGFGKCFWSSSCEATGIFGMSVGMGAVSMLRSYCSSDFLATVGWRIPFWCGALIGFAGIYLRHNLDVMGAPAVAKIECAPSDVAKRPVILDICSSESTVTAAISVYGAESHLHLVFYRNYDHIVVLAMITALLGCAYYSIFTWLVFYLTTPELIGGDPVPHAWLFMFLMDGLLVLIMPFWGYLADSVTADVLRRRGERNGSLEYSEKKPLMLVDFKSQLVTKTLSAGVESESQSESEESGIEPGIVYLLGLGTVILILAPIPAFFLISTKVFSYVVVAVLVMTIGVSMFGAALPSYLVCSVQNKSVRYSVLGVAYNISSLIFAGTAPLVQTALVMRLHGDNRQNGTELPSGLYSGVYIAAIAFLSLAFQLYNIGWFKDIDGRPK